MIERLEDLFKESALACAIARGLAISFVFIFGLLTVAAGILALAVSVWWLIGFVLFGVLTGVSVGIGFYLLDV